MEESLRWDKATLRCVWGGSAFLNQWAWTCKLCKDQPIKAGGDPPKNMKICVFHLADIIINEVVKDEFCVVPLT